MTKELRLADGRIAIVSDEDWNRVRLLSWSDNGSGYIRACWKKSAGGDGRIVYLHRFILGAGDDIEVCFADGDPLNNTRSNLQFSTRSRTAMRAHVGSKGVYKLGGRWRARISIDGRQHNIGVYATEAEAKSAVEAARRSAWDDPDINWLGVDLPSP